MKKTLRKKLVCMLMMAALLLSAAITYAQPASADNLNADEVNRFNVILVIDGSGLTGFRQQCNGQKRTEIRCDQPVSGSADQ